MKNKLIIILSIFFNTNAYSQGVSFGWANQLGGQGGTQAIDVVVDSFGNIYSTGWFSGTNDFDPGVGVFNLTSMGSTDIFITKQDYNGNFVWAKGLGGNAYDVGHSLTLDAWSNIYISGIYSNTVDFDPSSNFFNLTSNGFEDIFVLKLHASGDFIWAKGWGGLLSDQSSDIAIDVFGDILITGSFTGIVDFDPNSGFNYLSTMGNVNPFISKLDSLGILVWAKEIECSNDSQGKSITTDSNGNVYATGVFQGTGDFDTGVGTFNLLSSNANNAFISKLDIWGDFVWAKKIASGVYSSYSTKIELGDYGSIYLTGWFYGSADFDPSPATYFMTAIPTKWDGFVSKLDSLGNFIWSKQMGGNGEVQTWSIALDTSENIYVISELYGTADFDPGCGVFNLTSKGANDIIISKMDSSGLFIWSKQFGGSSIDKGTGIAVDSVGNIVSVGAFYLTADFNPESDIYNMTATVAIDAYVSKIEPCATNRPNISSNGSTSFCSGDSIILTSSLGSNYQWYLNGIKIIGATNQTLSTFSSGSYTVIDSTMGCSSAPSPAICLTINQPTTGIDFITSCSPIMWIDSVLYSTSNNTATHTIVGGNAQGCDSIVTLNLTIPTVALGTDVKVVCDSLLWIDGNTYFLPNNSATFTYTNGAANGCDSIVTLNLTISTVAVGTDVEVACDSLLWIDGNTYFMSNNSVTFTYINGATNGCDSVVHLDLTIESVLSTAVVLSGNNVLTANNSNANYQWVDCNNGNLAITGATSQTFVPTVNGSYAVYLTQNGCIALSECIDVTTVDLEELVDFNISVSPNPSSGKFKLDLGQLKALKIEIYNLQGQIISVENNLQQCDYELDISPGVYIIRVQTVNAKSEIKLILN